MHRMTAALAVAATGVINAGPWGDEPTPSGWNGPAGSDLRISGELSSGYRVGSMGDAVRLPYAQAAVFEPNGMIRFVPGWNEVVLTDPCNGWVTLRRWSVGYINGGFRYDYISDQRDAHLSELVGFDPTQGGGASHPADMTTAGTDPGNPGYGEPDGEVSIDDLQYYIELWMAARDLSS
ncbi:MAG: hypothetical protein AAGG07_07505 [Planctomycetota bacterium]